MDTINKDMTKMYNNENNYTLKVVGILRGNDDSVSYVSKTGGVGYTSKLTEYVINGVKNSSIVHEQENNREVNIKVRKTSFCKK